MESGEEHKMSIDKNEMKKKKRGEEKKIKAKKNRGEIDYFVRMFDSLLCAFVLQPFRSDVYRDDTLREDVIQRKSYKSKQTLELEEIKENEQRKKRHAEHMRAVTVILTIFGGGPVPSRPQRYDSGTTSSFDHKDSPNDDLYPNLSAHEAVEEDEQGDDLLVRRLLMTLNNNNSNTLSIHSILSSLCAIANLCSIPSTLDRVEMLLKKDSSMATFKFLIDTAVHFQLENVESYNHLIVALNQWIDVCKFNLVKTDTKSKKMEIDNANEAENETTASSQPTYTCRAPLLRELLKVQCNVCSLLMILTDYEVNKWEEAFSKSKIPILINAESVWKIRVYAAKTLTDFMINDPDIQRLCSLQVANIDKALQCAIKEKQAHFVDALAALIQFFVHIFFVCLFKSNLFLVFTFVACYEPRHETNILSFKQHKVEEQLLPMHQYAQLSEKARTTTQSASLSP
ncbi:hypothetical protein RFI_01386 [Reticulomyxa filosa]|uniref:Uncharacterized protein n=1 Tax=Reticulomyxa filosa TaxID=46433 RepID=X6PBX1_RETFI|nr:hypothetical protein RFI_01386 [Reticulomyxa filosa]|eukprot:ETO35676.1 hypothetical protein RFI_01386 [Reticulomyxa filosa]